MTDWQQHNIWKQAWWGSCQNTFEEQLKQDVYAGYMKLEQFAVPGHWYDMRQKTILDIGGGPCSLLLRCKNFKRGTVVDPCPYPIWVAYRYQIANVEYIVEPAESFIPDMMYDECWIYNCLQHVEDVDKIANMARTSCKKLRIFEYIEVGVCPGHPNNLTEAWLDKAFNKKGLVIKLDGLARGKCYYGVFNYE